MILSIQENNEEITFMSTTHNHDVVQGDDVYFTEGRGDISRVSSSTVVISEDGETLSYRPNTIIMQSSSFVNTVPREWPTYNIDPLDWNESTGRLDSVVNEVKGLLNLTWHSDGRLDTVEAVRLGVTRQATYDGENRLISLRRI